MAVHDRSSLFDAEKLVYLQQAIKQGSARSAIEGLSQSGDQYKEAIGCLKSRYSRPRLIHRAHVRTIINTPPLKEGRCPSPASRALKTMNEEPDPLFVTSINTTTSFEWQKYSQGTTNVPHYQDICISWICELKHPRYYLPHPESKVCRPMERGPLHQEGCLPMQLQTTLPATVAFSALNGIHCTHVPNRVLLLISHDDMTFIWK